MKKKRVVVLGGGIAGLSASYHLNLYKIKNNLFEKSENVGGLLKNIKLGGFIFDQFVHYSFAKDKYTKSFFAKSSKFFVHKEPKPNNYYKGYWLEHSPQFHLKPLPFLEKLKIILSFILRKKKEPQDIKNYQEWLDVSYGKYFSKNFTKIYTQKYWTRNPYNLETRWLKFRMPKIKLLDLLLGVFSNRYKNTFYGSNLRYPMKGGYESFLTILKKNKNIKTGFEVKNINTKNKIIYFTKKQKPIKYDFIISTIPLSELPEKIYNCPKHIYYLSKKLNHTSGLVISICLNKKIKFRPWFYIYDKSIPFARAHSPSEKSKFNVPEGCSSLQLEIYFNSKNSKKYLDHEKLKKKCINKILSMGLIEKKDILKTHSKYIKYANIIFDKNIYKSRDLIIEFLKKKNIYCAGRYGEWKYLWSNQAFLSGKKVAENINKII